jgi:hypothetical protein
MPPIITDWSLRHLDRRPGHPELVTAGTFAGDGTLSMWSAADPARFKILQVTAEQPGDGTSTAKNGITQT